MEEPKPATDSKAEVFEETLKEAEVFEETLNVETLKIDEIIRSYFGITLKELGPPGSIQRERFIDRYREEQINNEKGE
jgi:hypothetical protein